MEMLSEKAEGEKKKLEFMVGIFCHGHHGKAQGLCPECRELVDYAWERIDACPFMETKTYCSACEVHCYRPEMRERVREVMRYSGPRMMLYDPAGALRHMIFGKRR